jgi:hypothetical protein
MKQIANVEELGPRARALLEYVFEHPKATVKEMAQAMGISENRVYQIKANPKFQSCFPEMARRKLKAAVPGLTKRYLDLADQNENLGVAEKVVSRVLDSQKVLENQPQTQINIYQNMTVSDLRHKVEQISQIPNDVIDTEALADDTTTP